MNAPAAELEVVIPVERMLVAVLEKRVMLVRISLLAPMLVGTWLLIGDRHYKSSATFMPQSRRAPSALSGIAAQFGVAVPTQDGPQSPAFYADLLLSTSILGEAVGRRFPTRTGRDTTLADYLSAKGDTPEQVRERAVRALREHVTASANLKTGVVRYSVTTSDPKLSAALARGLLDQLDVFNQDRRKSQAKAERQFTERRLSEVRGELREAEDREQAFLQRNRDFRNAPELAFQHDRLAREVSMRQQLYTSLAQAFEQSKIEEVRDTPLLGVVEEPEEPAFPESRGVLRNSLTAMLGTLFVGCLAVLAGVILTDGGVPKGTERGALKAAWAAARRDVRQPFRALLRRNAVR